ncbi:MAG: C40 family peptidase [Bacteroidia bacterium]|nr:C40 family peptidase [Bacteroidia bacterium]HQV00731.1 C40 family peptidase [Bacteroidia bacterium]
MTHGICNQSIVPMRADAAHKSEMVSQLLFGELFEIIQVQNEWLRIKTDYDQYNGWVLATQVQMLELMAFKSIKKQPLFLCNDLIGVLDGGMPFPVVLGSTLPNYDYKKCSVLDQHYHFHGEAISTPHKTISIANFVEHAMLYLNAPYLWGGRSPLGIDCSGFTQMVFKLAGIKLKRDAYLQAEEGNQILLLNETQPADLAFFENDEGRITHVGLLIGENKIIHASGKVRVDTIDHFGIYNDELKKYSHKLRIIKRMI